MRFNINLASNPYEVAQSYRRQMTLVIAALGLIAVLLVGYIFYQRQRSRGINHQLAQTEGEIQRLDHEESQARAILNKPANRVIADQSDFLNQLFARKALSWTRIFSEMEKIVPPGLHVVSMKPEYTKSNDLMLHVIVATDSRERAVELVRKMEKSSHLRQAQIVAETVTTNQSEQAAGGGNIQFDIAAIYVPGTLAGDEAAQGKASSAAAASTAPKPLGAGQGMSSGATAAQNTARNQPVRPGQPREQH
jgi:type IV pilus assembly protein PilN